MKGYVYAVSCGPYIKIGMTSDIKVRIAGMGVSNPFPLSLRKKWDFITPKMARKVESRAHASLKELGLHHRGEWFLCSCEKIIFDIVEDAARVEATDIKIRKESLRASLLYRRKNIPILGLVRAEKEIQKRISDTEKEKLSKKARYAELDKILFVTLRLHEFKPKAVSRDTGIDSKRIYRFIHRGGSLTEEEINQCSSWLFWDKGVTA